MVEKLGPPGAMHKGEAAGFADGTGLWTAMLLTPIGLDVHPAIISALGKAQEQAESPTISLSA